MTTREKTYDLFISHATEDKDPFVRPLALALQALGVVLWYDEFSLLLGDSLSGSIDEGLASSRFGLVVISPSFLQKAWPEYELRGLIAREVDEGRVILPVWHGVTKKQVLDFSPPLADKMALKTDGLTAEEVALKILVEVRPDIYTKHALADLRRMASGDALRALQGEIDRTRQELNQIRQELAEYRCPYCGAVMTTRGPAPVGESGDWALYEEFDCGYATMDGFLERPCPTDPRFPGFDDFTLHFTETKDTHFPWLCLAAGKTPMARKISLLPEHGRTREEAEEAVRCKYEKLKERGREGGRV